MSNPNDSYIVHGAGASSYVGPDAVRLVRAIHLKAALNLYARSKMLVTRNATPTAMLELAKDFTGKTYKGRDKYTQAAQDVGVWAETMRAALPVEVRS